MDRSTEEELSITAPPGEQKESAAPGEIDGSAGLSILLSSPRVAAGVLTRSAWRVLEAADAIYAGDADDVQSAAIVNSGFAVTAVASRDPRELARMFTRHAGQVVWIGSPDGDPGLTDALAAELTISTTPPSIEMVVGSWDLPGARLLDAVTVMDTLRSPGGCPWDAQQTHDSLSKYLIEESYEALEAIEARDSAHLSEELGDVLLQVLFHARIAAENQQEPFDIDDVAGELVAKLIRRHPHVFADGDARTPDEVESSWEQIKAAEKSTRDGNDVLAGIPPSLPALLTAEKVLSRLARRNAVPVYGDRAGLGVRLLELVDEARDGGQSAEALLRREVRQVAAAHLDAAQGS